MSAGTLAAWATPPTPPTVEWAEQVVAQVQLVEDNVNFRFGLVVDDLDALRVRVERLEGA